MYIFLIPLLMGFSLHSVSSFTGAFSRRWGERYGRWISGMLRIGLAMPLWVIGIAMALRQPSPLFFVPGLAGDALGWLVVAAGAIVITLALALLRVRAAAPSTRDALECSGVYSYLRHPIYAGMLLELTGLALLWPSLAALIVWVLGAVWIIVQTRLEELDLVQRFPAYRSYMDKVPAFIPHRRG